jgi:branched-chain amino acid transport system permease protein
VLIITLGLSLALRSAAGLVWSHDEFAFPSFFGDRPLALGPVRLAPESLGITGASLALMGFLWALFTHTRLGRAMRAVAQNQNAARLMGISVEHVYSAPGC